MLPCKYVKQNLHQLESADLTLEIAGCSITHLAVATLIIYYGRWNENISHYPKSLCFNIKNILIQRWLNFESILACCCCPLLYGRVSGMSFYVSQ